MVFVWSFPALDHTTPYHTIPHLDTLHYTTHSDNVFRDILTVLSQDSLQKLDGDTWLQRSHWLVQSSVTVFDTPLRERKRDCDAINPSTTRVLKPRYHYEARFIIILSYQQLHARKIISSLALP
jgi:hypothetical protein